MDQNFSQYSRTRFAPSINGYLHLGHLHHLKLLEKFYRQHNITIDIRLEDYDLYRWREEYETKLFAVLDFFDFEFTKNAQISRQSTRNSIYQKYLEKLDLKNIFYCRCSRKDLALLPKNEFKETVYQGNCVQQKSSLEDSQIKYLFTDKSLSFTEHGHGTCKQNPFEQVHSMSLKNKRDQWTYQFVVVVDDIEQGIDLVVRGKDLLHTTGRYVYLWRLLTDREPPVFYHHDLILGDDGEKLSKRFGSQALHELMGSGVSKAQMQEMLDQFSCG